MDELGTVWRTHFGRRYPAMAVLGVLELFDPSALVELVGVAVDPVSATYAHLSTGQRDLLSAERDAWRGTSSRRSRMPGRRGG